MSSPGGLSFPRTGSVTASTVVRAAQGRGRHTGTPGFHVERIKCWVRSGLSSAAAARTWRGRASAYVVKRRWCAADCVPQAPRLIASRSGSSTRCSAAAAPPALTTAGLGLWGKAQGSRGPGGPPRAEAVFAHDPRPHFRRGGAETWATSSREVHCGRPRRNDRALGANWSTWGGPGRDRPHSE